MRQHNRQSGAGLPEAMMAVLLFSTVALALLHYQQRLEHRREDLRQYRQALAAAHQALECYRTPGLADRVELPARWRLTLTEHPRGTGCVRVSAAVCRAHERRVELNRWFCP